jgi:hypothetical protein
MPMPNGITRVVMLESTHEDNQISIQASDVISVCRLCSVGAAHERQKPSRYMYVLLNLSDFPGPTYQWGTSKGAPPWGMRPIRETKQNKLGDQFVHISVEIAVPRSEIWEARRRRRFIFLPPGPTGADQVDEINKKHGRNGTKRELFSLVVT